MNHEEGTEEKAQEIDIDREAYIHTYENPIKIQNQKRYYISKRPIKFKRKRKECKTLWRIKTKANKKETPQNKK